MDFWPETYTGAISLTFDDGMRSQLEVALPALDERSLRATFYLNPRGRDEDPSRLESWQESLAHWLLAQQRGHEMGNHSMWHPCSLNIDIDSDWAPGRNLIDWTLDQMEADILEAQRRLKSAFPGQARNSFAYPCYESSLGRGAGRVSYTPLIARHFVAGRARGENRGDLANDPRFCDLHHLSSWAVERQPGALMIGLVEQAIALGLWGIFTIHGIHEGHLPVGDVDLFELLDHLARRSDRVWVAPLAEVAEFVRVHQPV